MIAQYGSGAEPSFITGQFGAVSLAYNFHRILVPELCDIWSIIYDIILTVTTQSSATQGHDDMTFNLKKIETYYGAGYTY